MLSVHGLLCVDDMAGLRRCQRFVRRRKRCSSLTRMAKRERCSACAFPRAAHSNPVRSVPVTRMRSRLGRGRDRRMRFRAYILEILALAFANGAVALERPTFVLEAEPCA